MCGIVGYIGEKQAQDILVDGLAKLDYRGYDSAGIAVYDDNNINVAKKKGELDNLRNVLDHNPLEGHLGIGHTRWATHGAPSDLNAHPHLSADGKIAVVHNGIIDNYLELKEMLISKGYRFMSDTDTEVIAQLISMFYDGDLFKAVQSASKLLSGSYSVGVIATDEPDKLIAIRKNSPLIVGLGEGENFIASDIYAILNHTRDIYLLDNDETAVLKKDSLKFYNEDGQEVGKQVFKCNWDPKAAEKGGFDHFMLKEITEQPRAVADALAGRIMDDHIRLDDVVITKEDLDKIDRIHIVACGTAYNAGLIGKSYLEKYAKVPIDIETASEYNYKNPIITENTLLIVLSQSGETFDTLQAIAMAKEAGARVLAVTNVVGSSIAREADDVIYTNAGPEIAVASTKAYVTQVACMLLIALHFAQLKGTITQEEFKEVTDALTNVPELIQKALDSSEEIEKFAKKHFSKNDIYLIGRNLDYSTCIEGSLKIKEISYVHSESFSAGELKHGPIALIDEEEGTVVLAVATQENTFQPMLSNIEEVNSRGAHILAVAQENNKEIEKFADKVFYIPQTLDDIAPLISVVYLQLFAYYLAKLRGCSIDKPKNLAKAVTVQ